MASSSLPNTELYPSIMVQVPQLSPQKLSDFPTMNIDDSTSADLSNMDVDPPSRSSLNDLKKSKKPDMEVIAAARKARKENRRLQRRLGFLVKKTQKEPDNDLDNALAAFSLTPDAPVASSSRQPATAAAPPAKAGYYNDAGHFVHPKPRPAKKAVNQAVNQTSSTTNKVSKGGVAKNNTKRNRPNLKERRLAEQKCEDEAAALFSHLEAQDYPSKLNEMRSDVGLPTLETSQYTEVQLKKKISLLYTRWVKTQGGELGESMEM